METNKKVVVQGNRDYGKEIIQYLELMVGGKNEHDLTCTASYSCYYVGTDGIIDVESIGYFDKDQLTPIEEVLRSVAQRLVEYPQITKEPYIIMSSDAKTPEFPRMMWVWDNSVKHTERKEVHGFIHTMKTPWITAHTNWINASDADPRMPELTIEEAEAKFNIKIKRP
jgi:hypothetical protein